MKLKKFFRKYLLSFLLFVLFLLLTLILGSGPMCFFKSIYGIPCPACGMTRAFIALKNGDFTKAFYYHPLFIIPIIVGVVISFKDIIFFNKIYKNDLFWKICIILILSVWLIRMIFLFPNTPPMDSNKNALLPKLFDLLK